MRIIQLNLHLSCFHVPPLCRVVAALSTKAIDARPNRVLSTLSNHRGHRVRLHLPAALAWVSRVPLWGCWEARKANQNLNIYTGTHRVVSGGADRWVFPPPLSDSPAPSLFSPAFLLYHHAINKPEHGTSRCCCSP